jgi:hypothetical protein
MGTRGHLGSHVADVQAAHRTTSRIVATLSLLLDRVVPNPKRACVALNTLRCLA